VPAACFDAATLERLDRADEVELRTEMSRPVWVVVVDGAPYVRPYAGPRSGWYRTARREGRAEVDGVPVRVTPADPALGERVSQAYLDKYGAQWPGPVEALLTPPVVAATLRLEPLP